MLNFGQVIQLIDDEEIKDYIYLAADNGTVFLARIPNTEQCKQVLGRLNKLSTGAQTQSTRRALNHGIYFVVELSTEEFCQRLALLISTDYPESILKNYNGTYINLNKDDLDNIKKEILSEENINRVNPRLRELISKLN